MAPLPLAQRGTHTTAAVLQVIWPRAPTRHRCCTPRAARGAPRSVAGTILGIRSACRGSRGAAEGREMLPLLCVEGRLWLLQRREVGG